jgi:hypothetical protein
MACRRPAPGRSRRSLTPITFCVRGVVSPLLANGSLHDVFDCWVAAWRQTVATGDVIVVRYQPVDLLILWRTTMHISWEIRGPFPNYTNKSTGSYADDLVVGFQHRADAERFLGEFRERLATFGLELSAEKTRLIQFGRFAALNRKERGQGKPETFTFLGFTHYCGTRRSTGSFIVWRKTAKKRMAAKLQALKVELRRRMHEPLSRVGEWVQKVLTGYYQYHAIPGNLDRLSVFRHRLRRLWRTVLRRRSQRGRMNWHRLGPVLDRWIPPPRVLHPYPAQRFAASHPR